MAAIRVNLFVGFVLLFICSLLFLVEFLWNCLFVIEGVAKRVGFDQHFSNVYFSTYFLTALPIPWTVYLIWTISYLWNALWITYGWSVLIRRAKKSIPDLVYVFFSLNCTINIIWMYLFGNRYLTTALSFSVIQCLVLYVCLILVTVHLYKEGQVMRDQHKLDFWLSRILVLNGLAFQCSWVEVMTFINLGMTLQYVRGMDQEISSQVVLSLILMFIILYFAFEQTFLDRYVRHTVSSYFAYFLPIAGLLITQGAEFVDENEAAGSVTHTYSIVLLVIVIILIILKFVLNSLYACFRHINYPKQLAIEL